MSITESICSTIWQKLVPGVYTSVDVSQTKEKGIAVCALSMAADCKIAIEYFHQPFLSSKPTRDEVTQMIALWPDRLRNARCCSVDSPLHFAIENGGRQIDRRATWNQLGFGDYLRNEPQHAPTEEQAEDVTKTWIRIGMWFAEQLDAFEVYPTASFNSLHLWQLAKVGIPEWFKQEPDTYHLILPDGLESVSMRFLERLRETTSYGGTRTRFRKLSIWPYPDLWDAFGGAVTSMLYCSGLTENVEVENYPNEGQIVVPMRLSNLR